MNRLLSRANRRLGIGSAAALLAAASFLGTFLGILRTKLINANFSLFESDAYFAAFKIPDLVFFTLASGALGVAFLPILSERLQKNRQSAWEVATYILNFLAIVSFVASVVIIIFARPLLNLMVGDGFTPEQLDLSVAIMRIVSVNIFLFAVSTVLSTVQQSVGRFFFFAMAPLFYNASIIASIYLFGDKFGIVGLSLGVAIGAILQLGVIAFGMIGLNFKYRPLIDFKNKSFREVLTILPARSIDQGADYINSIVETKFASRLSIGSVTNYENALLLHNAPIMLIGVAISTAAFPRLTDRLAQGRVDLFRKEFLRVLTTMIWITMPVIIVGYFARGYLARIIFARDNREIAAIFGFLCIAIFFRIMFTIISRYFYAHKDTRTPLYVSLFVIALNIYLAYNLSKATAYGVVGLALAQSIVAFTEVLILVVIMIKRDPGLFNKAFLMNLVRIISVTGFTALAGFAAIQLFPLLKTDQGITVIGKLILITAVVFGTHILVSYLYNIREAKFVMNKLRRMILRPVKI
jgi:putative peptidoglycan lipid II flippase